LRSKRYKVNSKIFEKVIARGILNNSEIDEASGLAASHVNPGMLWTHNDSGDKARIFLLDSLGKYMATLWLTGVENRDWEDIAVGPGPDSLTSYIYIAEVGDNAGRYDSKYIYRIQEPVISKRDTTVGEIEKITFSLPDGARDVEALMIDPLTKDLYLITKRNSTDVYRLPYPQSTTEEIVAEKIISGLPFYLIIAADWSADGNEILIKSNRNVFYWKRQKWESIADLFRREPQVVNYKRELQGESVAFELHGKGYYTLAEKSDNKDPVLYYYPRSRSANR
jgi:hypothetical protein